MKRYMRYIVTATTSTANQADKYHGRLIHAKSRLQKKTSEGLDLNCLNGTEAKSDHTKHAHQNWLTFLSIILALVEGSHCLRQ